LLSHNSKSKGKAHPKTSLSMSNIKNMIQIDNNFYQHIRQLIEQARSRVKVAVNVSMVDLYWSIGQRIVEEEQAGEIRAEYGKALLKQLSERLTIEFGTGFNDRNLRYFRGFYQTFPIRNALRSELSWTQYRILCKINNEKARAWYMNEAADNAWSSRTLERQIEVLYYERLLSSKFDEGIRQEGIEKVNALPVSPLDFIRDPYILDFMQLADNHGLYEEELEQGLLNNIQQFLLELGKGFAFVARQQLIKAEEESFKIDLVFYNYLLKCFVLIDLKMGKLTHKDIGQMDMYVRMYEDLKKQEGDNPTIGIVLCSEKNEAVVKYSVLKDSQQLFASKYLMYLPTEEELRAEIEKDREIIERAKRLRD
jgi:predicted nuclease of restriction endonuclease-like (RecB) superfamily